MAGYSDHGMEILLLESGDKEQSFDSLLQSFIEKIELTDECHRKIKQLVKEVEEIFSPHLPGCQVKVFGSCGSNLAFKGSDVDLFLEYGLPLNDFVKKEAKLLSHKRQADKIRVTARVPKARVPIVKFVHLTTELHCDINAKNNLGVCNTNLIRFLMSFDNRIRPLMMVIKYWAKTCGISSYVGNHTNFNCYSIVMLVVFYLQQCEPAIIPPIFILQKLADEKVLTQGWDCSFCDDLQKIREKYPMTANKMSVKELLLGFFEFYHSFDFQNVICPLLGRPIPVVDFENSDKLPMEMDSYKKSLEEDNHMVFKTNVQIRTQDPFELGFNVTKNVSDIFFFRFKNSLKYSLEIANSTEEQGLLKALLTIEKEKVVPSGPFYNFCKKNDGKNEKEWHSLQEESLLLVLETIFILQVEKFQDLGTTSHHLEGTKTTIFRCTGCHDLWTCRKQVKTKIKNQFSKNCTTEIKFEREFLFSSKLLSHEPQVNPFSFKIEVKIVYEKFDEDKIVFILHDFDQQENEAWKKTKLILKRCLRKYLYSGEMYIRLKDYCAQSVKDSLQNVLKDTNTATPRDFSTLKFGEILTANKKKNYDTVLHSQQQLLMGLNKDSDNVRNKDQNKPIVDTNPNKLDDTASSA